MSGAVVMILMAATCLSCGSTSSFPSTSALGLRGIPAGPSCPPAAKAAVKTSRRLVFRLRGGADLAGEEDASEDGVVDGEACEPYEGTSVDVEDVSDELLDTLTRVIANGKDTSARLAVEMQRETEARRREADEPASTSPSLPPPPGGEGDEPVELRVPCKYGMREAFAEAGMAGENAHIVIDSGDYDLEQDGSGETPLTVGTNRRVVIRSAEPTEEELEEFTRMQANDEVDVRGEMMGALIRGQVKLKPGSCGSFEGMNQVLTRDDGVAACIAVEGGPWRVLNCFVHAQPTTDEEGQWGGIALSCGGAGEVLACESAFGGLSVTRLSADAVVVSGCGAVEARGCAAEHARFSGFRCVEKASLRLSGCQVDYSGTGISVAGAADVYCEKTNFARLVFGGLGTAGAARETRVEVRECYFLGEVWKGGAESEGEFECVSCTGGVPRLDGSDVGEELLENDVDDGEEGEDEEGEEGENYD